MTDIDQESSVETASSGSAQTPMSDHLHRFAEQMRDKSYAVRVERDFDSTSWGHDVRDAVAAALEAHCDGQRTAGPDSEAVSDVSSLSNDFITRRFMKQE